MHEAKEICFDKEINQFFIDFGTEKDIIINQYTGFKDADENEIYENDTLEYVSVWGGPLKQVKVEFNELVGAWYAGSEMLCNLLTEQHNEEWKKSQNFKPNENQKVRIKI